MNTYDIGDVARVEVTGINVGGVPTDPTTLTLSVQPPSGTPTSYTYGVGTTIVKDAIGEYHALLTPSVAGRWTYNWRGTGAAAFAESGTFYIRAWPGFCTAADVAGFLQITIAADSAPVLRAIREASAAIQNYCRQLIMEVTDDEYTFDVRPLWDRLFLPELPVGEVTEVVENGVTLVDGTDYKLGRDGILYRVGAYWYPGIQTVIVTYSHGYVTTPEDVLSVCTRAAARAYQAGLGAAALAGVAGVKGQTIGDYSVTYGGDSSASDNMLGASAAVILLPSEKGLLSHYRMKGP